MPTIKELRLRIKSLQNTSKITSAMKMVSASKLRRAQDALNRTKPYYLKMQDLLEQVAACFPDLDHPLMKERETKRVRYYLISSDRGLAGSFNNNLFKFFSRSALPESKGKEVEGTGLGRRARDFLARNRIAAPKNSETLTNAPVFANASAAADRAIEDFVSGDVDQVFLVYNRFRSVLSQTPFSMQALPFPRPAPAAATAGGAQGKVPEGGKFRLDYIVEPNPAELFDELLPKLVAVQFFRCLLENAIGEHSARMTAMDSATKNTKDLIGTLTLRMNRARQAAITKELIEIVSGAEALV